MSFLRAMAMSSFWISSRSGKLVHHSGRHAWVSSKHNLVRRPTSRLVHAVLRSERRCGCHGQLPILRQDDLLVHSRQHQLGN